MFCSRGKFHAYNHALLRRDFLMVRLQTGLTRKTFLVWKRAERGARNIHSILARPFHFMARRTSRPAAHNSPSPPAARLPGRPCQSPRTSARPEPAARRTVSQVPAPRSAPRPRRTVSPDDRSPAAGRAVPSRPPVRSPVRSPSRSQVPAPCSPWRTHLPVTRSPSARPWSPRPVPGRPAAGRHPRHVFAIQCARHASARDGPSPGRGAGRPAARPPASIAPTPAAETRARPPAQGMGGALRKSKWIQGTARGGRILRGENKNA